MGVQQPFSEIHAMLRKGGRCRRENFPHHVDITGAGRADLQSPAGFGAIK